MASGRGRRPDLPSPRCSNIVFLQLHRLKHTCPNIMWDDIGALLLKMFPLAKWHCTRKLLERIFDDFMKASIDSSDKRKEFYKQDVDLNHCGVFLH